MRIGEIAKGCGVSVETIRYYQRKGLLDTPERPYGQNREYTEAHLNRLQFIKRAQALGFSLAEVATLLSLSAAECNEVEEVASRKLKLVREKRADLARIEAVLAEAISGCKHRRPFQGCPIIESLIDK